jgi:hypothetical protein
MSDPDYEAWLKKDLWRVSEFVLLACEFEPEISEGDLLVLDAQDDETRRWVREEYADCRRLSDQIYRSIGAGELKVANFGHGVSDAARPIDFIQWAIQKDFDLPDPMLDYERAFIDAREQGGKSTALSKRERQKRDTLRRYKDWREEHSALKEQFPGKTKTWYAEEIKSNKNLKYSVDYIRKHL